LFVPLDETLPSRRRESYLLMSSYGSSYGMLSRNGRSLYTVDLMNRTEDVLTMERGPLGDRRAADDATRRVNRRKILERLAGLERLYAAGSRVPPAVASGGAIARRRQPGGECDPGSAACATVGQP
jgi:hypothetical protein